MGLFDLLTGRRPPLPGTPRRDGAELRAAVLALNRDSAPFRIREGGPEGADLVAEWRLTDARWREVFAGAGLKRTAQLLLRLDDQAGEVRAVQRDLSVEWRAGAPALSVATEGVRGQSVEASFGTARAFREEDLRTGQVHLWRFRTAELKGPLQEVAMIHGWTWRPVAFGKL